LQSCEISRGTFNFRTLHVLPVVLHSFLLMMLLWTLLKRWSNPEFIPQFCLDLKCLSEYGNSPACVSSFNALSLPAAYRLNMLLFSARELVIRKSISLNSCTIVSVEGFACVRWKPRGFE
jgi:hypothetical protein